MVVATAVLVLISGALGVALSEVVYRVYLYWNASGRFVRRAPETVGVYSRPFWVFDERFGYTYPKGERIHVASISKGRVTGCSYWSDFNEQGNIGRTVGHYGSASLKILVFGDSFTATVHNGMTWPSLLQERLMQRLGRTVHVVNFGRDGYGLLQMFDLAAAKIPEWKPDLAVIAFITNDLQRVRFWRTVTKVDGLWRYLVSPDPTANPDSLKSYDTGLYHPDATPEWCQSMKNTGRRDRVLGQVEHVFQQGVNVGERRAADLLALRHSYLAARLRHGDPFRGLPGVFTFPVIQYASYSEDRRFMESLRAVEATGVPYILAHLAFYPELKESREYITTYQEATLLKSLAGVTGKPILETRKFVGPQPEDLQDLIQSPDNYHPSPRGLLFYADVVAHMLVGTGAVR